MSARDGTVLSDNPAAWDIERMARLDWEYIRQCIAKAGVLQLEQGDKKFTDAVKCFVSCMNGLVAMDDARRDREELAELQQLEQRIDEKLKELKLAARGSDVGTASDPSETPPSH